MWPWTNHGASWTLGFSICRELARYLPNCPQPYKLESGTGWPLTTFGLKGGVSLLWYKSSQFMGLKNTWFLISVCRKKVLIRSSPLHGCSPSHPHMTLSSNSIGSWPKTFADKVTCTSGWFPGTIERAFCSQTLPFWITRNPTLFPHDICLFHTYLLNNYSVPAPVGFEGMSLNKTADPALRVPRESWGPLLILP